MKMLFLPTCTGVEPLHLWHWRNFVTAACRVNSTKLPLILNAVTKVKQPAATNAALWQLADSSPCTLLIYLMNAASLNSSVQQLSD